MTLEHKDLSRMLETAIVAARLAGQRAMEDLNFIKASLKNASELVTQADIKCQQIIIERIKETYPDHGIIAEEGTQGGIFKQPPRGDKPFWWVIDPIDGTNNYANGILLFAVSIAVMYEGQPIVGVIFDPATDSIFTAVKDGQAQLNGRRITVSEKKIDKFSSIGIDSHCDNGVPGWMCEIMQRMRFQNLGASTLQIAYVAKGSFVGSIFSRPKLWDIAAGVLLVKLAGGVVSNWQGEKIFPVDTAGYEGGEFPVIIASKKVHAELLEIVKSGL